MKKNEFYLKIGKMHLLMHPLFLSNVIGSVLTKRNRQIPKWIPACVNKNEVNQCCVGIRTV